ncbi:MAG: UvrD-helicase domain-containing protein [Oscillospiraceae bacterium]|nr:UvrD-helicase domain-containing protein [Oscillospiraceae bacterium]MCI8877995.1 UvrD-helicase domain-containing protein [Oscillospiraceae bacterium]
MTQDFSSRYAKARRAVIARRYHRLNPTQREAVLATEGPLLLLAGAGSGKTTVLINRVDNLLTFGRGSDTVEVPGWAAEADLDFLENFPDNPSPEDWQRARRLCAVEPAAPWSVIAITFTNKAAGELKERLERMCGTASRDIWAATFHSACIRILRRDVESLGMGFTGSFTIYDTDDSKRVIKDILKAMSLDEKEFQPRSVLSIISNAKDQDWSPDRFAQEMKSSHDWRMPRIAEIYTGYQRRLREANAMDFDDIILHTVHLLQKNQEVREHYQRKFRYVLVDEYQDTNHLQYMLTKLLAGGYENICVVGDDDQSIYRFRGANIENILSFENQYKACRTIRLEQNYRSTQNILDAANTVIRNNTGRKGKNLWTDAGAGEKVLVKTVFSESDEANYIAGKILESYGRHEKWGDNAVLYRMNAQSNALEMALKRNGIPYKVYGGMKFFDRAEVKDMLAYLCVIHNGADDLRLRRIVNVPARGIGATSVERVAALAQQEGTSLCSVMERAGMYPALKSSAVKLENFIALIQDLRTMEGEMDLPELYDAVCEKTGYIRALEEKGDMESRGRIENVRELRSSIVSFLESEPDDPSLAGFLDSVALYTDLDDAPENDDFVSLMTMHSAKGLEFPNVYVVGMEEGVFPSGRVIGESEEMEEERRLCYVAMTRAKKRLTMTTARQRMLYGRTSSNLPSRFLEELPAEPIEWLSRQEPKGVDRWGEEAVTLGGGSNSGAGGGGQTPVSRYGPAARTARPARPLRDTGFTASAGGVKSSPLPSIQKGDSVEHRTFGRGMVLAVTPMGNDAMVEIAFDGVGTKKLMLRAAGARIKKL